MFLPNRLINLRAPNVAENMFGVADHSFSGVNAVWRSLVIDLYLLSFVRDGARLLHSGMQWIIFTLHYQVTTIFAPTFEENGIFMLGIVFFIQSIFTDRNNNFQLNFFIPH